MPEHQSAAIDRQTARRSSIASSTLGWMSYSLPSVTDGCWLQKPYAEAPCLVTDDERNSGEADTTINTHGMMLYGWRLRWRRTKRGTDCLLSTSGWVGIWALVGDYDKSYHITNLCGLCWLWRMEVVTSCLWMICHFYEAIVIHLKIIIFLLKNTFLRYFLMGVCKEVSEKNTGNLGRLLMELWVNGFQGV